MIASNSTPKTRPNFVISWRYEWWHKAVQLPSHSHTITHLHASLPHTAVITHLHPSIIMITSVSLQDDKLPTCDPHGEVTWYERSFTSLQPTPYSPLFPSLSLLLIKICYTVFGVCSVFIIFIMRTVLFVVSLTASVRPTVNNKGIPTLYP